MIKINLLSPEKKEISAISEGAAFIEEEREAKTNIVAVIVPLVLTIVVIAFLYITQKATLDSKEKLLKERKARKEQLEVVLKEIENLEKTRDLLARKVKIIENLKSQQQRTVKMMDQLSKSLPDWVWLTNLRFSSNSLSLSGKTLTNSLIADFINNLRATNFFSNVQFKSSKRQKQSGIEILSFSLSCSYKENFIKKEV